MEQDKPIIEFEGEKVKPNKQGYYKCPFKCGDPRYPEKKWKTEKGFRKHMEKCPNRPSVLKEKERKKKEEQDLLEYYKNYFLNNDAWEIGTELPIVRDHIIKPEYKQRGNRMVRVRYEAVHKFDATFITINDYAFKNILPFGLNTDYETFKHNTVFINGTFRIGDVKDSIEEAEKEAKQKQEGHDEHLRFSSMVR